MAALRPAVHAAMAKVALERPPHGPVEGHGGAGLSALADMMDEYAALSAGGDGGGTGAAVSSGATAGARRP